MEELKNAVQLFLQKSSFYNDFTVLHEDPAIALFQALLIGLVSFNVLVRVYQFQTNMLATKKEQVASTERSSAETTTLPLRYMQWKFLSVFWLLRGAFWMSGPYFYAAYASKAAALGLENGVAALISQLSLAGYGAIALFGPFLGRFTDQYGRKLGTITAAILYGLGSLSINSTTFSILFVGRALAGVGTSLLTASPEAWLVSEFKKQQQQQPILGPSFIRDTFGMAYAYDSVVALLAGQIAGWAATQHGPTGPFQVSPIFSVMGAVIAAMFWNENKAAVANNSNGASGGMEKKQQTIWDAVTVIKSDTKILFLGGVQAFFEGAMYIFLMQWPPTMNRAIQNAFGDSAVTPYGTAFSCFMACCMVGSTIFGMLSEKTAHNPRSLSFEFSTVLMLGVACIALVLAMSTIRASSVAGFSADSTAAVRELWQLIAAYFVFEACVGMYFPSIGTLRSKYLPDSHRSVIMTLFGVPLNVIVVTVFLFVHKLGDVGALGVAAISVGCATACAAGLFLTESHRKEQVRHQFKEVIRKVQIMNEVPQQLAPPNKNLGDEHSTTQSTGDEDLDSLADLSERFLERLSRNFGDEYATRQSICEHRDSIASLSGPQFL